MMTLKEILKRFKSPTVWVSIGSLGLVILTAAGVKVSDLTTWAAVGNTITKIFSNPSILIGCGIAIFGFLNNPTNKTGF